MTEEYLETRARLGSRARLLRALAKVPDVPISPRGHDHTLWLNRDEINRCEYANRYPLAAHVPQSSLGR